MPEFLVLYIVLTTGVLPAVSVYDWSLFFLAGMIHRLATVQLCVCNLLMAKAIPRGFWCSTVYIFGINFTYQQLKPPATSKLGNFLLVTGAS